MSMFDVKVRSVSPGAVTFSVKSIHPDSGEPASTATFALMMLFDPIAFGAPKHQKKILEAPLARAMDSTQHNNRTWLIENARSFVASVKLARETLSVKTTDPAWTAHLAKGMSWQSAAWDMGPGNRARVRRPNADDVGHAIDNAGFRRTTRGLVPIHGESSYVADPVVKKSSEMSAVVKKLAKQPVLVARKSGRLHIGTMIGVDRNGLEMHEENRVLTIAFADIAWLGRAWLKAEPVKQRRSR